MAKKGKAAKPASKATAPLKQPALPGAEGVRDLEMDRYCEGMAAVRDEKNRLISEEDSIKLDAHRRMQEQGLKGYVGAGIEFLRSPGAEVLRVRRVSGTGQATDKDLPSDAIVMGRPFGPDDEYPSRPE